MIEISLLGAKGAIGGQALVTVSGEANSDTPTETFERDAKQVMDLLNTIPSGTCDRVLADLLVFRMRSAGEEARPVLLAALEIITRYHKHPTLSEWADANKIGLIPYGECMTVPDQDYPHRSGLWALADYVVTSVTGGTIWLAPRKR